MELIQLKNKNPKKENKTKQTRQNKMGDECVSQLIGGNSFTMYKNIPNH